MHDASVHLPQLRHRDEQGRYSLYTHPLTLVGHIVALDVAWVGIHEGRQRVTHISVDDLVPIFGDRDMTFGLLLDAQKHNDLIHVGLMPDRITYDNPAQLQRFVDAPR